MTTIANFEIQYYSFLSPEGEVLTTELPEFAHTPDNLIALYKAMMLTRSFDAKAVALQRTGKLGTYPSSLGQEAVSVGIGSAMQMMDVLCPSYREQGAFLQRGVSMQEILTYWGGDERGNNFANNKNDFPICVPIGTQCLHAAGVATAMKLRKQPYATVSVCGDGATSQGDFYEALNLAGAWKLPLVFIVNNNQWAISVPRQAQTGSATLAQKAIAGGIICEQVDGNDVIAVKYAVETALQRARRGGGPSVIEAITYRLCDHTTADDASRYRSKEEVQAAWQKEPIKRLKNYLINHTFWSEGQDSALQTECTTQVEDAVQAYLSLLPEPLTAMFDYHYANMPESLIEQREIAVAAGEKIHG